jgi:hypothetical protein
MTESLGPTTQHMLTMTESLPVSCLLDLHNDPIKIGLLDLHNDSVQIGQTDRR